MKFIAIAICLLSMSFLSGCTGGDDKDSATTDTADSAE